MATAQATHTVEDDFFIVEDIDLSDESELRRVVADVETLVAAHGKRLQISVLSAEQWQTVLTRWLSPERRRGASYHTHALRDPRNPQHLVISPSGVRGINERQANMYQELVYWLLRCLPTPLPKGPLLAGVNDIVAGLCSEQVEVDFYTHHAPREAALVRALIEVLIRDFEHTESEWVLLLRRNPDRFFQALRKTKFCAYWMAVVKRDPEYAKIMSESTNKRDALIEMLRDENLTANSSFLRLTERALVDYSSESVSA